MAQFTPVNIDPTANGAYFSMQLANGEDELDVFAVFGLRADRTALDARALRSHFRKVLIPHCFERGTASSAKTQGPEIPTWQIANVAKGILWAQDASSLVRLQETWIGNPKPSVQVWNPFAEPGSPEYFLPVASKAKREYSLPSFDASMLIRTCMQCPPITTSALRIPKTNMTLHAIRAPTFLDLRPSTINFRRKTTRSGSKSTSIGLTSKREARCVR